MRKKKQNKNRKENNFKLTPQSLQIGIFTLFIFSVGAYLVKFICDSDVFTVRHIVASVVLDERIQKEIYGKSLFAIRPEKIYTEIYQQYPEYKVLGVVKEFPSTLKIEAYRRIPFVQLHARKFYPLDREGFVLTEGSDENIPKLITVEITGYDRFLRKGEIVNGKMFEYIFLLVDELKKKKFMNKFPVRSIDASSPDMLSFTIEDIKVIVGENDFVRKLYIFENLLNRKLKKILSTVNYVDLRYKKVYIGYKQ